MRDRRQKMTTAEMFSRATEAGEFFKVDPLVLLKAHDYINGETQALKEPLTFKRMEEVLSRIPNLS